MDHEDKDPWWASGKFWDEFAPLMFDAERLRGARKDIDDLITLTSSAPGSRILDAGCGPGRHTLELARRGYEVVGVDMQQSYLDEAAAATASLDHSPEFRLADLRDFSSQDHFHGAISMFQSIGYTEDPADDLKICRNIRNSLKPGGWFLMESDGKEVIASGFEERTWFERDGRLILLEYGVEGAWSRLRNHWRYRDEDGEWYECDFSYRLFSAFEMGMLLEEAGFASIEFFGGLDGRPYDHLAINLVALARRP